MHFDPPFSALASSGVKARIPNIQNQLNSYLWVNNLTLICRTSQRCEERLRRQYILKVLGHVKRIQPRASDKREGESRSKGRKGKSKLVVARPLC